MLGVLELLGLRETEHFSFSSEQVSIGQNLVPVGTPGIVLSLKVNRHLRLALMASHNMLPEEVEHSLSNLGALGSKVDLGVMVSLSSDRCQERFESG